MRIYTLNEKPNLFSKLKPLLNKSLKNDFITDHMLMRCTFNDPNYNPKLTFLAIEDNELIGVLIGVERTKSPREVVEAQRNIAWVKVIAIHPKYKDKPIFKNLLTTFLNEIKGKNEIRVANFAIWHFHPGVDIEYEYYLNKYMANGFKKYGEVIDYHVNLKYFHTPNRIILTEKRLKENGLSFKLASHKHLKDIKKWININFSPYWALEAETAVKEDHGGLWICHNKEGNIIGFSAYGALEPNWLGPIGVIKDARHLGIGSTLLFKSLNSLRLNGIRHAIIPWTRHLFFYSQIPGITEIRHYHLLKLTL
ncbi:MAG TPA: GNAT family N-acetyltransferase [Candidatus Atribacteria bacterium]|nr:GNAT family N-acetyltransferase [Candidatus Atribacteria bacterium]